MYSDRQKSDSSTEISVLTMCAAVGGCAVHKVQRFVILPAMLAAAEVKLTDFAPIS
jgi:hypothetical protein